MGAHNFCTDKKTTDETRDHSKVAINYHSIGLSGVKWVEVEVRPNRAARFGSAGIMWRTEAHILGDPSPTRSSTSEHTSASGGLCASVRDGEPAERKLTGVSKDTFHIYGLNVSEPEHKSLQLQRHTHQHFFSKTYSALQIYTHTHTHKQCRLKQQHRSPKWSSSA
jgi:hypothetical protein